MDRNEDRNYQRALRAGARVRASGGNAIEVAIAMVEIGFDKTAAHIDLKARVAAVLAKGAAHPASKAHYGGRARMLSAPRLEAALAAVESSYEEERNAARWRRRPPLQLAVLCELRLLLRFLRRRGLQEQFPALLAILCEREMADAGAERAEAAE
jgi:hypothetical protein